jgi:S-adenosylmethionine synthetase
MTKNYLFTSESVTEGHPDKICDQISDAILDEVLKQDKNSRVAVETFIKNGIVIIGGEISTKGFVDLPQVVRKTIKKIGYLKCEMGIDYRTCGVLNTIEEQSIEIARNVNKKKKEEQGAGDQGIMFGFACSETKELMPLPIFLANKLSEQLAKVRKTKKLPYLYPDGKTQVTVEYDENNNPIKIHTIVISANHSKDANFKKLKSEIKKYVIEPVCKNYLKSSSKILINPAGKWTIGGPLADAGLTGRKIMVDTYGGMGRHGGGAFSGKDPSKVDRSASYVARYIAKNIVSAKLAVKCEVQLSYAIGKANPISLRVQTFGTGSVSDEELEKAVKKYFPLKPAQIIQELNLLKPIYLKTATYGHFGRNIFSWEKTDKVNILEKHFRKTK